MKITKRQLAQIIKEEIQQIIEEERPDNPYAMGSYYARKFPQGQPRDVQYEVGDTIIYFNLKRAYVTVKVTKKVDDINYHMPPQRYGKLRPKPGFEGISDRGKEVWGFDDRVMEVVASSGDNIED